MLAHDAVKFGELSREIQEKIAELIDLQESLESDVGELAKVVPVYYNFKGADAGTAKKDRLTKEEKKMVDEVDELYASLMMFRKTLLKMKAKV